MRWVEANAAQKVKLIQNNSRKKIVKAIRRAIETGLANEENIDQISKGIISNVGKQSAMFSKSRALRIARTEVATAQNVGSRNAAKSLGIPNLMKEWVNALDERSRSGGKSSTNHVAMNGVRVGQEEKFRVPSNDGIDLMDGPLDPQAPADQVVNCRCVLMFVEEEKGINPINPKNRRQVFLDTIRRRSKLEKGFQKELSKHFRKEGGKLKGSLKDLLKDGDVIRMKPDLENAAMDVLDQTEEELKEVMIKNMEKTAMEFGLATIRDFEKS